MDTMKMLSDGIPPATPIATATAGRDRRPHATHPRDRGQARRARSSRGGRPVSLGKGRRMTPTVPMLCEAHGLPQPVAEFRFDADRRWRFDWAWPVEKIAVEVDGGIWRRGGGAHSRPRAIIRDVEKSNAAQLSGWLMLRVLPDWLRDGTAVDLLVRAFVLRGNSR